MLHFYPFKPVVHFTIFDLPFAVFHGSCFHNYYAFNQIMFEHGPVLTSFSRFGEIFKAKMLQAVTSVLAVCC